MIEDVNSTKKMIVMKKKTDNQKDETDAKFLELRKILQVLVRLHYIETCFGTF